MSSTGNFFNDETSSLFGSLGSPDTPEFPQNRSNGMIPVSINGTNPLMSSQRSNLLTYQENSTILQNPIEMSQGEEQGNNGFPTMTSSPFHLQDLNLPSPLIDEELSHTFSSLFHTESIGSQNYVLYQTTQRVISTVNMYGMQVQTPPVYNVMQNESYNLSMVNNSAMTCPALLNHTSMIPTFGANQTNMIPTFNADQTNMIPTLIADQTNMIPTLIADQTNMIPTFGANQTNMIPTFNAVDPRSNSSSIPQPQVSAGFTRYHVYNSLSELQRLVDQFPSRFSNLNTETHIGPYENSTITPQGGSVLGTRGRSSYESQFEIGETSSSAQRRRIESDSENVASNSDNPDEERIINGVYDPGYERLGLESDPHLRKYHFYPD